MKAYKRIRNLYDPKASEPFKLSRSRLENHLACPRCFYLDRRLGVDRVSGPAFTLNSATDTLLKKEFDAYRKRKESHPIMVENNIDVIPFSHESLDTWRNNFKGVSHLHTESNLLVFGAIDDVWVRPDGALHVVDYKSTCTQKEITLEDAWKQAYKRQMEIYQWLLRQNGFEVSNVGYFVYVNARTDLAAFNETLEFRTQLIPYDGNADWVEQAVCDAQKTLASNEMPASGKDCQWCAYRDAARDAGA
jgi:RecB family exonuclease